MPAKKTTKKPVKKAPKKTLKKTLKKTSGVTAEVPDYRYAYVYLRTMLDAIEMGSLHYFLEGKTSEDRNVRASRLMQLLKPVMTQIEEWNVTPEDPECMTEPDCPPGYTNCNGCCVPYPCPGDVPPEVC